MFFKFRRTNLINQNSSNCLVVVFVLICASLWLLFTDKLWNICRVGQMDTVESNPPTNYRILSFVLHTWRSESWNQLFLPLLPTAEWLAGYSGVQYPLMTTSLKVRLQTAAQLTSSPHTVSLFTLSLPPHLPSPRWITAVALWGFADAAVEEATWRGAAAVSPSAAAPPLLARHRAAGTRPSPVSPRPDVVCSPAEGLLFRIGLGGVAAGQRSKHG